MSSPQDTLGIQAGDDVFGNDGEKVGTVSSVQSGYLIVEKGFFFPTDYYIPMSAITTVDSGRVFLNVTKDAALHSGWDTAPEITTTGVGVDAYPATTGAAGWGGDVSTNQPEMAAYEATSEDDIVIPVREEELSATVRERQAGAVRVEKHVVEEDRVLEVPVSEEQIRVERRVVDRPADGVDADAFEEIVIEVPLTAEDVELRKQARVAEEVVVSKEAVQHTEQVRGTVRREEVFVDDDMSAADLAAGAMDRSPERPSK
jgi:uncharacterized protein (TIGR02271 family)